MSRRRALDWMIGPAMLACVAAAPVPERVDVDSLASMGRWDGEVVEVDGWLGRCDPAACAIYPDEATARRPRPAPRPGPTAVALNIVTSTAFLSAARPLRFAHVLLTARDRSMCLRACLALPDDLTPIAIRRWAP